MALDGKTTDKQCAGDWRSACSAGPRGGRGGVRGMWDMMHWRSGAGHAMAGRAPRWQGARCRAGLPAGTSVWRW